MIEGDVPAWNALHTSLLEMRPVFAWILGNQSRHAEQIEPPTMQLAFSAEAQVETWQSVDEAFCQHDYVVGSG